MNELIKRSASGILYVALISFAAYYSLLAVSILMGFFLFIGSQELGRILQMSELDKNWFSLISIISYYLLLIPIYIPLDNYTNVPFAVVSAVIIILASIQKYDMVFGWIYLAFPLALLSFFPVTPDVSFQGGEWVYNDMFDGTLILLYFVLMWTNDVMAYVTGRLLGRNKLAPDISPGKTWEGFFGGLSFTVLAATILSTQLEHVPASLLIPVAIIIVVFGTLGDLLESMLKRQANIKDSGSIMPGHEEYSIE